MSSWTLSFFFFLGGGFCPTFFFCVCCGCCRCDAGAAGAAWSALVVEILQLAG